MTTAQRIRHVLIKHGDSVRKASQKTGIPKSTLCRLLEGSEANLGKWIAMLAATYQVDPNSLVGGQDPKSDFDWSVRCASSRERFDMVTMTVQDRVRMTLEFLARTYPRRCSALQIALVAGMGPREVETLLASWDQVPPDLTTTKILSHAINTLTGISARWFDYGLLDDEPCLSGLSRSLPKVVVLAQRSRAHRATALARPVMEVAERRHGGNRHLSPV